MRCAFVGGLIGDAGVTDWTGAQPCTLQDGSLNVDPRLSELKARHSASWSPWTSRVQASGLLGWAGERVLGRPRLCECLPHRQGPRVRNVHP